MASRRGPTLAERSGTVRPTVHRETARHCWVVDSPGHPGRFPGLLVEWRRSAGGWEGRAVYAIDEPAGSTRLIERWLPAACLEAAEF